VVVAQRNGYAIRQPWLLEPGKEPRPYPPAGAKFTLEELQAAVGGWIEMVGCPVGTLVMNEEGKLRGLDVNDIACGLAQGAGLLPSDRIVGLS
jgi:hypothetical protein